MGYRKVGWLEQCWYILKWKLTNLFKGGGEEVKQKKGYNWHGKSTWASKEHEREMAYLRTEPTAKQKKFYTFLKLTLKEHGVEVPLFRHALMTRADYSEYISELVQLCKDNGIPIHENGKKFDRVAVVEADGSVHEKMVERKEDKPCST